MLTQRFNNALLFASELHARQTRKGADIPYLSHLMAVAGLVLEHGGDEDEAIAGLLHDAVEDQGATYPGGVEALRRVIADRFGAKVLKIVDDCSDTDKIPKPPWQQRKEDYIAHLSTADSSTLLVSCADKVHNSRAILTDYHTVGEDLWSRFNGGREGTLWYYRALADAFAARPETPRTIVAELERVVGSLEQCTQGRNP
jgi:(p)ppGpp synthase/HD superfamily hydrolase